MQGGKILLWAFILATAGGLMLLVGIGAAFGRAGNWSNNLAGLGIGILILAGIATIVALAIGVIDSIIRRKLDWYLPYALIASALALWAGWVAINL